MKEVLALTKRERRQILDLIYGEFVGLSDELNNSSNDWRDRRGIKAQRRKLAKLINKIEGYTAIKESEI